MHNGPDVLSCRHDAFPLAMQEFTPALPAPNPDLLKLSFKIPISTKFRKNGSSRTILANQLYTSFGAQCPSII